MPATPSKPAPSDPSLPSSVRIGTGAGGLAVVHVTGPGGTADIYLHGAQVTAWAPTGAEPVLWLSRSSRFAAGAAIRGGVPICFPWFGAHQDDPSAPAHGFARLSDWALHEAHDDGDDVVLTFRLADTVTTRASAWPHPFEASYSVTVGARLTLALTVTNHDAMDVSFEEAMHTYLSVVDIETTHVSGLAGAPYLDRLGGPQPRPGEDGPVQFASETDRIYLDTAAQTRVVDASSGRSVTITKSGSASTVVWNPWQGKAAAMADFGDDEWPGMVCVETCNIQANAVRLAPGESHTMTAVFALD